MNEIVTLKKSEDDGSVIFPVSHVKAILVDADSTLDNVLNCLENKTIVINESDWIGPDDSGLYRVILDHNMSSENIISQAYNENKRTINYEYIEILDLNRIQVVSKFIGNHKLVLATHYHGYDGPITDLGSFTTDNLAETPEKGFYNQYEKTINSNFRNELEEARAGHKTLLDRLNFIENLITGK